MDDHQETIHITDEDIAEANRLSLHCPICAGTVEQNTAEAGTVPIYCTSCETLYHVACWEQNGGKCAVLGCEGTSFKRYGVVDLGPTLTIERREIPRDVVVPSYSDNGRAKRLKAAERKRTGDAGPRSVLRELWYSLLRAIRIWPSDPS